MKSASWCALIVLAGMLVAAGCAAEGESGLMFSRAVSTATGDSTNAAAGPQTVADVTSEQATEPPPGQTLPAAAAVNVQIQNASDKSADVTLRFLRNNVVVHLTLLRVPAGITSLVVGPDQAEYIEAGGTDENGLVLPAGTFERGVDFDESKVAIYRIGEAADEPSPGQPLPGTGPVNQDGGPDTPGVNDPPSIEMLEPSSDVQARLGSLLTLQWRDADPDNDARIGLLMRPVGGNDDLSAQLAPVLAEDPDGPNDRLRVVIEGIAPGVYEVVGAIDDGAADAESVAPGLVTVVGNPEDAAPTLTILQPSVNVTVIREESLAVQWDDASTSDAYITFYLDADGIAFNEDDIQVSPPLAAGPDGGTNDSGRLAIAGVPTGEYELLGVINDGELLGTARARGRVTVIRRSLPGPPPPSGQPCSYDEQCSDGIFCNGIEQCTSNGFCAPGDWPCQFGETCSNETGCIRPTTFCEVDEDCYDGIFCNGLEQCNDGVCVPGGWPCNYGDTCNEEFECVPLTSTCDVDEDCDDGFFCNGSEFCLGGLCFAGEPPCSVEELCDERNGECLVLPPFEGQTLFAYPDFDQGSDVFLTPTQLDPAYDLLYFIANRILVPGDDLRFYWVPVADPEARLPIDPSPPSPTFWRPYGFAILEPWPLQEYGYLDCATTGFADAYVEVDLVHVDVEGIETVLETARVQFYPSPGAGGFPLPEDAIIRVWCEDIPR